MINNGIIVKGAFKYRQVVHYDYLPEWLEQFWQDYEDNALEMIAQYVRENLDDGSGDLTYQPTGDSSERKGCIKNMKQWENYCAYVHGSFGYFYVENLMECPADAKSVDSNGIFH